jgi:hypothetical protein
MANAPHLFEDLKLVPSSKKVDGIGEGLEIKGTGTLVFRIQDDSGKRTGFASQIASTYLS